MGEYFYRLYQLGTPHPESSMMIKKFCICKIFQVRDTQPELIILYEEISKWVFTQYLLDTVLPVNSPA